MPGKDAEHPKLRLVVIVQALTGLAAIAAGTAHNISIVLKVQRDALQSRQTFEVLIAVGLGLIALGVWNLLAARTLQKGSLRGAIVAAAAFLLAIAAIAVGFDEYRGVPLAAAPLADLIVLLTLGRRAGDG